MVGEELENIVNFINNCKGIIFDSNSVIEINLKRSENKARLAQKYVYQETGYKPLLTKHKGEYMFNIDLSIVKNA